MIHPLAQYDPELEMFEGEVDEIDTSSEEFRTDADETGLAAELLELSNEAELTPFLRKLVRHVEQLAGTAAAPERMPAIVRSLARALRRAAPRASARTASAFGRTFGGRLATIDDSALGLELEGLSAEDSEFETARRLIRFALDAAGAAFALPYSDSSRAARAGVLESARCNAPGLVRLIQAEDAIGARPIPLASLNGAFARRTSAARPGRWIRERRLFVAHNP